MHSHTTITVPSHNHNNHIVITTISLSRTHSPFNFYFTAMASKDSAIGMSTAADTVPPLDSLLPDAPGTSRQSRKSRGRRRTRAAKAARGEGSPPGSVQVAGGESKKASPLQSSPSSTGAIPLTGWGDIGLYPFREHIRPTFTLDACPYAALVDTI